MHINSEMTDKAFGYSHGVVRINRKVGHLVYTDASRKVIYKNRMCWKHLNRGKRTNTPLVYLNGAEKAKGYFDHLATALKKR